MNKDVKNTNVDNKRKTNDIGTRKDNGDGCIYFVPPNKWVAKIQIGKQENGKPKFKQFSAIGDKGEDIVKRKLKEFKKERGKYVLSNESDKTTLGEYITHWFKTYQSKNLKGSSKDRLESTIINHIIPEIGYLQFNSVTQDNIQSLINKKDKEGLSASSLKKIKLAISACYKQNLSQPPSQRLVDYNPTISTIISKEKNIKTKMLRIFTEEEIIRIKNIIDSKYKNGKDVYPYGYAYILTLNTGLRLGEALALQTSEIDLINKKVYIDKNVVVIKNRDEDGDIKKGYNLQIQNGVKTYSGQRWITLNNNALFAVDKLKSHHANGDFLIANKYGDRVTPQAFSRTFSNILEEAKISNCSVHTLRHTFASLLFKQGVDVKIVSRILGHSSVKITYDIYIHLIEEQQQSAVNLIPNL